MDINVLKRNFFDRYGNTQAEPRIFFTPGRVNLIGEHTDYNGGYVFPCALTFGTYLVVRPISEPEYRFATLNFDYTASVPLDKSTIKQGKEWINYPLGVIRELTQRGMKPQGLETLYYGDIPNGAGLSSSASIEVLTAYALNQLFSLGLDNIELVKLSQSAENNFVGVNCGIMDQFAVGMGKKDNAIALDCNTLYYEYVPAILGDYALIIGNTNKRRGLADSKYNERRAECDRAVEMLNKVRPVKYLCELTLKEFLEIKYIIDDPVVLRRALHAVSEHQRVKDAINELKAGNLKEFGKLMNASHDSLRDDYEVTGSELDAMVDAARKVEGVIGSRMTGAGFGGCTVSLLHKNSIDTFRKNVAEEYTAKTGLVPDFYIAGIGDGAHEILL